MLPQFVGLNGKKGSGKDTVGQILIEEFDYKQASFARLLKVSVASLFGIDVDDIERAKNDPQAQVTFWIPTGLDGESPIKVTQTLREFLQRYGTEAHRDVFGDDFWVEQATKQLDIWDGSRYVFTDARFPNELRTIHSLGGTNVRILRPEVDDGDGHASEAEPPKDLIDRYLHNTGTIDDLKLAVKHTIPAWSR